MSRKNGNQKKPADDKSAAFSSSDSGDNDVNIESSASSGSDIDSSHSMHSDDENMDAVNVKEGGGDPLSKAQAAYAASRHSEGLSSISFSGHQSYVPPLDGSTETDFLRGYQRRRFDVLKADRQSFSRLFKSVRSKKRDETTSEWHERQKATLKGALRTHCSHKVSDEDMLHFKKELGKNPSEFFLPTDVVRACVDMSVEATDTLLETYFNCRDNVKNRINRGSILVGIAHNQLWELLEHIISDSRLRDLFRNVLFRGRLILPSWTFSNGIYRSKEAVYRTLDCFHRLGHRYEKESFSELLSNIFTRKLRSRDRKTLSAIASLYPFFIEEFDIDGSYCDYVFKEVLGNRIHPALQQDEYEARHEANLIRAKLVKIVRSRDRAEVIERKLCNAFEELRRACAEDAHFLPIVRIAIFQISDYFNTAIGEEISRVFREYVHDNDVHEFMDMVEFGNLEPAL